MYLLIFLSSYASVDQKLNGKWTNHQADHASMSNYYYLQWSENLRFESCNLDESLNYNLPNFWWFLAANQKLVLVKHDSETVPDSYL